MHVSYKSYLYAVNNNALKDHVTRMISNFKQYFFFYFPAGKVMPPYEYQSNTSFR